MDTVLVLAIVTVIVALLFDYTNGFHDAANIVATMIASRAMLPAHAVLLVAVFEFLGPLLGGTAVATCRRACSGWMNTGDRCPDAIWVAH